MPTAVLTDEQVVELVTQLPPERKQAVLFTLAKEAHVSWKKRLNYAESQLMKLCAERGSDWDKMSEDEREAFINKFVVPPSGGMARGHDIRG